MTDAVLISIIGAGAAVAAAYLSHRGNKVGVETKKIAEETRSMADGRLTDMTRQVNDLTGKLASSEGANAKLIAEEVGKASENLISRAQTAALTVTSVAEAAADALLKRAEERAMAIISEAARVKPARRLDRDR